MIVTGNALKRARAWLGWSQTEMSAAMGVSLATYQRREALAEEHIRVTEESHVMRLLDNERATRQIEVNDFEGVGA